MWEKASAAKSPPPPIAAVVVVLVMGGEVGSFLRRGVLAASRNHYDGSLF